MRGSMKKISSRKLVIIFAAIVLFSAVWIAVLASLKQEILIAEIYSDGQLMYSIDLNKVTDSYTIELPHNTILVEHGQIRMESADCPDQICVKQGEIKNGVYPIVCLPNRVEIRMTNKEGIDAITGR